MDAHTSPSYGTGSYVIKVVTQARGCCDSETITFTVDCEAHIDSARALALFRTLYPKAHVDHIAVERVV